MTRLPPSITFSLPPNSQRQVARGRRAWALRRLIDAGAAGVQPVDHPAPRWSGYVHKLREMGVHIETIRLKHAGAFPGTHGKYVLRSAVVIHP